jgi:hypothetical protein
MKLASDNVYLYIASRREITLRFVFLKLGALGVTRVSGLPQGRLYVTVGDLEGLGWKLNHELS